MKAKWKKIGIALLICVTLVTALVYEPSVSLTKEYTTLDLSLTENEFYLSDDNFETEMTEIAEPYLEQYFSEGYYSPEDGVENYYRSYVLEEDKGTIVISHGFSENIVKYNEVIYYFLKAGYSVYGVDHRGHGYSQREIEDTEKVSIEDFDDYVNDLATFVKDVVIEESGDEPLYLFAHSMGGGIGARVLEEYPDLFDKAILSAPMMEIALGMSSRLGLLVSNLAVAFGFGDSYVPGHGGYTTERDFEASAGASLERYNYWQDKIEQDENYQTWGATYSWLRSCLSGVNVLLDEDNLSKVTTPVLLFQAEYDSWVLPDGQNKFVNNVDSAELVYVEDSKHEVFNNEAEIRIPYYNTIFNYLAE